MCSQIKTEDQTEAKVYTLGLQILWKIILYCLQFKQPKTYETNNCSWLLTLHETTVAPVTTKCDQDHHQINFSGSVRVPDVQ